MWNNHVPFIWSVSFLIYLIKGWQEAVIEIKRSIYLPAHLKNICIRTIGPLARLTRADDKCVDVRLSRRHCCLFLALLIICQLSFSPLHMLLIMICQLCFSPLGMLLVMICLLSKSHVPLFVALRISLHSMKYVFHALTLFCKIKSRL